MKGKSSGGEVAERARVSWKRGRPESAVKCVPEREGRKWPSVGPR